MIASRVIHDDRAACNEDAAQNRELPAADQLCEIVGREERQDAKAYNDDEADSGSGAAIA